MGQVPPCAGLISYTGDHVDRTTEEPKAQRVPTSEGNNSFSLWYYVPPPKIGCQTKLTFSKLANITYE
jgi:hypothetical protein